MNIFPPPSARERRYISSHCIVTARTLQQRKRRCEKALFGFCARAPEMEALARTAVEVLCAQGRGRRGRLRAHARKRNDVTEVVVGKIRIFNGSKNN